MPLSLRKALVSVLAFATLSLPVFAQAATPDASNSSIIANQTTINADGIDAAEVSVTVKDMNLAAVENQTVTLTSSRGASDEIINVNPSTDILGKAYFRIRSLRAGTSVITASVGGVTLQRTLTLTFQGGLTFPVSDGDLIKIPDDGNPNTLSDTAVYYYALDGKRYVFPNEKVYYTWYPDFSKVKIIPIDQMSLIPIGGNITYKPGSKLVKFPTT